MGASTVCVAPEVGRRVRRSSSDFRRAASASPSRLVRANWSTVSSSFWRKMSAWQAERDLTSRSQTVLSCKTMSSASHACERVSLSRAAWSSLNDVAELEPRTRAVAQVRPKRPLSLSDEPRKISDMTSSMSTPLNFKEVLQQSPGSRPTGTHPGGRARRHVNLEEVLQAAGSLAAAKFSSSNDVDRPTSRAI